MAALRVLSVRHGLAIIEDAAQAHGGRVGDRRVGSFGVGSFSFYATKNVTAGEGGVVTTNDDSVADRVRLLRNQGMRSRYNYEAVGRNLRMTDLQAAVAVPQLRRLPDITRRRAVNADALSRLLRGLPVVLPPLVGDRPSVWHQYTVLLPADADRDAIVADMAASGVQAGVYYPSLVWDHDVYRQHPAVRPDDTPMAADVSRRCLSLPVHPRLGNDDLVRVAAALSDALEIAAAAFAARLWPTGESRHCGRRRRGFSPPSPSCPPSTTRTAPLMKLAAGSTRDNVAWATSSGFPYRRRGTRRRANSALFASGMGAVIAVSMGPGQMQFTVMPSRPSSTAIDLVRPMTPCFEVVYAPIDGVAPSPSVDAMFTTRPPSAARSWGSRARTSRP